MTVSFTAVERSFEAELQSGGLSDGIRAARRPVPRPAEEDDRHLAQMLGTVFLLGLGLWGAMGYGVWKLVATLGS